MQGLQFLGAKIESRETFPAIFTPLKVEIRNNDRTPYKGAVGRIISFTAIGAAG